MITINNNKLKSEINFTIFKIEYKNRHINFCILYINNNF